MLLPTPNVPATTIDVKTFLKFHLFQERKIGWENVSTTNKSGNVTPSAEFYLDNSKEEVSLYRLRIGHTRITRSHLITKTPSPLCQSHPLYQNYRVKFNLPSSINSLFKNDELT